MKFLVGLILVVGIGYGVMHFGGLTSFDPAQQGRDAKAAVKPGMSWTKVIAAAAEPGKCRFYVIQKKNVGGNEIEISKPGPFMPFDAKNLENRLLDETLPEGFEFLYVFTTEEQFMVKFDAAGDVEYVSKPPTMNDLLDR
ncbi:MAG: hypothetical protein DHS20C16_04730 [Phycisphaerae bacterium]|nr:MAG: hypothetical protein DHS20C16_04730 [Phycisphaerae bacterium]